MSGYAGITFVASSAFIGFGAYISAILSLQYKFPFPLSVLIAAAATSIAGIVASISLRNVRNDYLAIGTLGLGLIMNEVYLNLESITNGAIGITGIPEIPHIYMTLTISLLGSYLIVLLLTKSTFGNLITAIRDNEILVQSLGKSTFLPQMTIYAVSFAFLGLAGAYLGHYLSIVDPTSFSLSDSIGILTIVIIGGIGSPTGAILGAFVYVYLPAFLKLWGLPPDIAAQVRQGGFGLFLIILMMVRPQGLLGNYKVK
jgi:branched-chain amino acid transport system permease protein